MKKTILIVALAVVASASFTTAQAGQKDKKKKQATEQVVLQPVQLLNGSDSVSYAGGKYITEGLFNFLRQQGVDTAYMADFVAGFREVIALKDDPKQKARVTGMQIAEQVRQGMMPRIQQEFTETPDTIVPDLMLRAFTDELTGDNRVMTLAAAQTLYKQKQQWNKAQKEERLYGPNRTAGRRYLDSLRTDNTIIRTESGLMYKVLVQGEGEVPQKTDKVLVHYEGRLVDGTVFDASKKHGDKPASFRADQVIKGWTEALTMMPVGSKWQLYIPYELAYGDRNMGNIKPFSALIFDVELVGIDKPAAATPAQPAVQPKPAAKKALRRK